LQKGSAIVSGSQRLRIPRYALEPEEVHVWHLFVDTLTDADLWRQLQAVLTPEELVREQRYAHERDRRQYFLARVLARTVLGSYLGRACTSLHFTTTPYGKPLLPPTEGQARVHFNLTHSHGAIACAVSPTREVGIDIEDEERSLAYLDLAERYFAPPEASHLRGLQGREQRAAFFAIWTLKEAFVKALGHGLTYPLDNFAFDLDGDRLCAFRPLAESVPTEWHFFQFQLGPRHRGAVAVQGTPDRPVRMRQFDWSEIFLASAAAVSVPPA
jgi:4'-phosphopantetheinyl transferase